MSDLDATACRLALTYIDIGSTEWAVELCNSAIYIVSGPWSYVASDAKCPASAYLLGGLLAVKYGMDAAAQTLWRMATLHPEPTHARSIGTRLAWRPDIIEAECRMRDSALTGDRHAAYELGRLLTQRGDDDQARTILMHVRWLAGRAGDTRLLVYSSLRLKQAYFSWQGVHGRSVFSEEDMLLSDAAEAGDHEALFLIGVDLDRRFIDRPHGASELAEGAYRRAADAGNVEAAAAIGQLRSEANDTEGAIEWWRRAAAADHAVAACALAESSSITIDERLKWARRAAELGHPKGYGQVCELERQRRAPIPS